MPPSTIIALMLMYQGKRLDVSPCGPGDINTLEDAGARLP